MNLGFCTQCERHFDQWSDSDSLYVEWSDRDTVEGNGCVAEQFCSWECAARWFSRGRPPRKTTQAGRDLHSQQ
jgi:hypothetical protein